MNGISGTEWKIEEYDNVQVRNFSKSICVPEIIGRLLWQRNIRSINDAKSFFNPSLSDMHDPSLLPDIDRGVERLYSAIKSGEKICVHGDYDVDGVTSTALLVRTLSVLKANVTYRLPHRIKDGYGIKAETVEEISKNGCGLIITCDCGITACDAVERANNLGVDLIVTDHHEPGAELPNAAAVINPKRSDAEYPFRSLAGVGVALKFAQCLVRRFGYDENSYLKKFSDLAAMGTVADVVPLLDENRAIVKNGLDAIGKTKKVGLQAMLQSTNMVGKPISTYGVGFVLGPRINAMGRMDDATPALRLLLTKDKIEARNLAMEMEYQNSARRQEQKRIFDEAVEQAESKDLDSNFVLVLSNSGWNSGIVGIVAGKICEQYNRPAILISRDETNGVGHGSARSVDGFSIIDALRNCSGLLENFGGHTLAAGLSIKLSDIDEFEQIINDYARKIVVPGEIQPRLEIDAELNTEDINRNLADAIKKMEPFGEGNLEPVFLTKNLSVLKKQRVGDGSHLKLAVCGKNSAPINCIAFGFGDYADAIEIGAAIDICYNIQINSFNGYESLQLNVKDMSLNCCTACI